MGNSPTHLIDELSKAIDAYEAEVGERGMPFNEGWNKLVYAFEALDNKLTYENWGTPNE